MSHSRKSLILCGLLTLLSCGSPTRATSVLVEVKSDLVVGTELTLLTVQLFDRAGTALASVPVEFSLTTVAGNPAQFELPVSFALTPTEETVTDFRLVVTGRGPMGDRLVDVIESQTIAGFLDEKEVMLPISLNRSCLAMLCRDGMGLRTDMTCDNGQCVPTQARTLETTPSDALMGLSDAPAEE